MTYNEPMLEFIELRRFTKYISSYMSDDEYRQLQMKLMVLPDSGKVIPRTRGARKLRWSRRGMGKRGGYRVVYYYRAADEDLWMLAIYAKSDKEDFELTALRKLTEVIDGTYEL